MNIYKSLFIVILLITGYNNTWAQKDSSNSSRITVFDNDRRSPSKTKKPQTTIQDIIKIDPLLVIDGDVPIYFERVLNESFSVEIAPGFTYDDYSQDLNESLFNTPLQDVQGSRANIGYSFKVDLKYFPGVNNMLDGIYLSPEVSFRHYVIDYPENYVQNGSTSNDYIGGYANRFDLKLLFGGEEAYPSNFVFDWYVGVGLRSTSALQYIEGTNSSGALAAVPNNESFLRPALYAGIKLGIGF